MTQVTNLGVHNFADKSGRSAKLGENFSPKERRGSRTNAAMENAGQLSKLPREREGVDNGTRTRDLRNHNPTL